MRALPIRFFNPTHQLRLALALGLVLALGDYHLAPGQARDLEQVPGG